MAGFHGRGGFGRRQHFISAGALITVGGIFFSSLTVLFVYLGSSPRPEALAAPLEAPTVEMRVDLLTPLQEIPPGAALKPSMFTLISKPAAAAEKGMLTSFEEVAGMYADAALHPGLPVYQLHLTKRAGGSEFEKLLPNGTRAMTIKVNELTSFSGQLQPGMRVDILWTTAADGQTRTRDIVQCVPVLAVERTTQVKNPTPDGPIPGTVTLQVTRQQGADVVAASSTGNLSLMLCGEREKEGLKPPVDSNTRKLMGQDHPAAEEPKCSGTLTSAGQRYCVTPGGGLTPIKA